MGQCAAHFLYIDGDDNALRGNSQGQFLHAVLLPFGHACESKATICAGSQRQMFHLLFELGMAEQEAQWRTQVVELFCGNALYARIAGGVEPCEFSIEKKDFSWRRTVIPLHAAGLFEQQRTTFSALYTHALIGFSEAGFE